MVGHAVNNRNKPPQDIIDSTMGNMGYFDSESYGLTWKVRGLCTVSGELENVDIFDDHQVFGDIKNSDIYGAYLTLDIGDIGDTLTLTFARFLKRSVRLESIVAMYRILSAVWKKDVQVHCDFWKKKKQRNRVFFN